MKTASLWSVLLCGALFGFGLSVAQMTRPEIVLDFLNFRDLGLLLVLGSALMVAMLAFQLGPRMLRKPLLESDFKQQAMKLNRRTLTGAGLFGMGWGLSGVCPGPAIGGLGVGNWPLLWALAGILIGAYIQGRWFSNSD